MDDAGIDARALELFERVVDHPERRAALLAGEPAAVIAGLAALEDASRRARLAFPTEEDARPRRRPMPLPDRVGVYRLLHPLGEGGMGLVFAAERCDGLFEHRVAIKLIHPDRFSERALARFADERRLLARLDHPGIARLLDGGVTADGWPFIIMERVDGAPIDAVAATLPDLAARVALVAQVCAAVAAAHAALVVHGDIKPGNVLVDGAGRTRLLDFGVARLLDAPIDDAPRPSTAAFASPAQRGGAPPQVADDIHALGILLRAVASAGARDAHLANPADRDLAAIAAKAASVDPGDRYGSADGLAHELARWRDRRPVAARRATMRYVAGLFLRRNRRGVAIAAALALVLAAVAGTALAGWQAARQRSALAAARTDDLRTLARYQLFVIAARLEHQPRSTALRRELVREAEAVLANAVGTPGTSRGLALEAAQGYRLLAAIEGAPDRPSLGDIPAAERSLRRAAALVARDPAPDARALYAGLLLDEARLAGWGGRIDRALALLARARAAMPANRPSLGDEIDLLRADTLVWNGDYPAAQRLALAIAARPHAATGGIDAVLRRDRINDRVAEATYYRGDVAAALGWYNRAVRELEAAARRRPDDPTIAWALARQRWNVGTTLLELGRPAEATAPLHAARAATAAQAAEDPDDQATQRRLRAYDLTLAQAEAARGHVAAAVAALRRNIAAREAWRRRAPASGERTRDVAVAIAALGDVHAAAGDVPQACARYAQVRGIHARLAASGRLSRLDSGYYGRLVADSMHKLHCTPGG